jgi:hypothetical protein
MIKKAGEFDLRNFKIALQIIAAITILLSFISACATLSLAGYVDRSLCFTADCIAEFRRGYSGVEYIVSSGLKLLGAIVAIFGVYIALKKYLISAASAALTGHTEYLQLFQRYLMTEIDRREYLNASDIDIFFWYSRIFPKSAEGDVSISIDYLDNIKKLADVINKTNKSMSPGPSRYDYKEHQSAFIVAAERLGIRVQRLPKNDFTDMECQLLEFIDAVNVSFAPNATKLTDIKQLYV